VTKLQKYCVGFAAASGVLIALASLLKPDAEPQLNGIPLSHYLGKKNYGELRTERDARESIRAFGTNAVPHLIRMLDARESRLKTSFNEWADYLSSSLIRFRFASVATRQIQAASACQELGPIAAAAIPSLARLIGDPQLGYWAVAALAEISPQTFPLLTNALNSPWPATRFAAAGHLRLARPREQAVPPLLLALTSQESEMRSVAAESLGALGVHSPAVIAALTASLDDPNTNVRVSAACSLGWCGGAAVSSVPKLQELHRSQEGTPEQQRITEAIRSIETAAAQQGELSK